MIGARLVDNRAAKGFRHRIEIGVLLDHPLRHAKDDRGLIGIGGGRIYFSSAFSVGE